MQVLQRLNHPAFQFILVLAVSLAVFGLIQFSTPNLAGIDGYFHIKMALLMRERGPLLDFNWLPFTILNAESFADHHFLYHLLLIPFTFGDLATGAKLAATLFPSLMVVALWMLLRGQGIPFAAGWALGALATSDAFLYRMLMPRAQAIALLYVIVALHLLLNKRQRLLLPLGFLFAWTYDGFPLLLAVLAIHAAVEWLYERKFAWRSLAFGAGGVLAGLVVNPYFPNNVVFAWRHIMPKLFAPTGIPVGSEWYPYETAHLLENSAPALLLLAAGLFALGWAKGRMQNRTALALALTFLFGFMLFQSRRFIEYFPPVALLFAAFAFTSLFPSGGGAGAGEKWPRWAQALVGILLAALVAASANKTIETLRSANDLHRYQDASAWLLQNTAPGAIVFQADWDDFPQLFFHNHANTYIVGLDPTYMQLYDAQLYDLWAAITQGHIAEPSAAIAARFGSNYALTDPEHIEFIKQAMNDPRMQLLYQDDHALIFAISE